MWGPNKDFIRGEWMQKGKRKEGEGGNRLVSGKRKREREREEELYVNQGKIIKCRANNRARGQVKQSTNEDVLRRAR